MQITLRRVVEIGRISQPRRKDRVKTGAFVVVAKGHHQRRFQRGRDLVHQRIAFPVALIGQIAAGHDKVGLRVHRVDHLNHAAQGGGRVALQMRVGQIGVRDMQVGQVDETGHGRTPAAVSRVFV